MKQALSFLMAGLALMMTASCGPGAPDTAPAPERVGEPAAVPSSGQAALEVRYRGKLLEIQRLNGEMVEANRALDFPTVNAKGKEALARSAEARAIALQFDDPRTRAKLLADLGKITSELEYLVKITGG